MTRGRSHLGRRQFVQGVGVAGLGLLAGCGRLPGQPVPAKLPRLGYLTVASSGSSPAGPNREVFVQGLRDLGYVEGHSIIVDWRFAAGSDERLAQFAAELAQIPQ
jgi:putative tryptophan/tyrosine transport system substrate-binding protein